MIPHNRPSVGWEDFKSVINVFSSEWLSEGPITMRFEKALEEYLGAPTCVVNSGSSALMCALLASGFEPYDRVAVPAITHIATLTAPHILGARVRIVDVDLDTFNIMPGYHNSKFVIPVDVGGVHCDGGNNAIWDSAQAFPRSIKGTHIFSFQMTKQLTTVEGGCITSYDKEIIDRCRRIKNYGRTSIPYLHDIIGTNWRTTDIASAIGLEQLKKIDQFILRRREIMSRYRAELKSVSFQKVPVDSSNMFAFVSTYDIGITTLIRELRKAKIDARRIWIPLHMQPCVITSDRVNALLCPNAEAIYKTTISLPLSNGITDDEVDTIIKEFNRLSNA